MLWRCPKRRSGSFNGAGLWREDAFGEGILTSMKGSLLGPLRSAGVLSAAVIVIDAWSGSNSMALQQSRQVLA
jgi:hypothetical protein